MRIIVFITDKLWGKKLDIIPDGSRTTPLDKTNQ